MVMYHTLNSHPILTVNKVFQADFVWRTYRSIIDKIIDRSPVENVLIFEKSFNHGHVQSGTEISILRKRDSHACDTRFFRGEKKHVLKRDQKRNEVS